MPRIPAPEGNLFDVDDPIEILPRCPHNNMAPCITNSCAAWRFTPTERVFSTAPPPGSGWVSLGADHWVRPDPNLGYCGLAGRP